jgi:predicted component of type VI protein secretion system
VGIFDKFERKLEGAVSGAFARAFRSSVEPVEIASQLQTELDKHAAVVTRGRTIAPNDFHVELSSSDYDRLGSMGVSLAAEFVGVLEEHAQEQRYAFAGPVRVELERQPDLDTGLFRIRVNTTTAAVRPPEPARAAAPTPASTQTPAPEHALAPRPESAQPAQQAQVTEFPRRLPEPIRLALYFNGTPNIIRAPGAMIGRGSDCDIRIDDPGASRRHAEIRLVPIGQQVSIQIVDLGSTNGTRVDGERIDSAELHDGSKVTIGNTVMTVLTVTTDRR